MVDNTDPGFSTNGQWLTMAPTTGDDYEGADYLKIDHLNPPANGSIIDNTDPGFATTGTWTAQTNLDYYGADWLKIDLNDGSNPESLAIWTPTIALSGAYDVHARRTSQSGSHLPPTPTAGSATSARIKQCRPTTRSIRRPLRRPIDGTR